MDGFESDCDSLFTSTPNDTLILTLTDQFVAEACNIPRRLYCPFCLFDFEDARPLRRHLQESHGRDLRDFANDRLDKFAYEPCPYCHGKFYAKGLLAKHAIRTHERCVFYLIGDAKGAEGVSCKFCPYETSRNRVKLLFIHAENKHMTAFNEVFVKNLLDVRLEFNSELSKFAVGLDAEGGGGGKVGGVEGSEVGLVACEPMAKLDSISAFDFPPTLRNNLGLDSTFALSDAGLDSPSGSYSGRAMNCEPIVKGILKRSGSVPVRRKLRFDLPDLDSEESYSFKENSPKLQRCYPNNKGKSSGCLNQNFSPKSRGKNCRKTAAECSGTTNAAFNPFAIVERGVQPLADDREEDVPFKCGICDAGFNDNLYLAHHAKKTHAGLALKFHAKYKCGACGGKFYKNSFLLKHCRKHHAPRCLGNFDY